MRDDGRCPTCGWIGPVRLDGSIFKHRPFNTTREDMAPNPFPAGRTQKYGTLRKDACPGGRALPLDAR